MGPLSSVPTNNFQIYSENSFIIHKKAKHIEKGEIFNISLL